MPDEEIKSENSPSDPAPIPEDHVEGISKKYGGDFNRLAAAFKEMQGRADKLEQTVKPPTEYKFHEDLKALDDTSKVALEAAAKESGLSQKQFDTLAAKVNSSKEALNTSQSEQKKALETSRKEILGNKEDVEKLKAFYAGRLPSKVVEQIIDSGSIEEISELKSFRESHLNKKSSSGMGDGKVDSNQREAGMEKYQTNSERLVEIATEKRRADPYKFNALCREENKLALENTELLNEFGPRRPR